MNRRLRHEAMHDPVHHAVVRYIAVMVAETIEETQRHYEAQGRRETPHEIVRRSTERALVDAGVGAILAAAIHAVERDPEALWPHSLRALRLDVDLLLPPLGYQISPEREVARRMQIADAIEPSVAEGLIDQEGADWLRGRGR